jgi:hypothetical protein
LGGCFYYKIFLKNSLPFDGCLFVFAGDFRQVLPIISGASRPSIAPQCINRYYFCPQVRQLRLETNMRVQHVLQSDNAALTNELQLFAQHLLRIGEGRVETITLWGNIASNFIPIPT